MPDGPLTWRHWSLFVLFMVALFVAVAAGTYLGLSIVLPRETAIQLEVLCFPEHAIMPEDLGRPEREWEAMNCR